MGSVHGTYLKIEREGGHECSKGQNYLIGTDIYFNVIDIQTPSQTLSSKSYSLFDSKEEFMTYIAKEYAS
jgi:hypothetical protein